mgnify:CR=1 FL=1
MTQPASRFQRALHQLERAGNALPHPAVLFVGLTAGVLLLSAAADWAGLSALPPVKKEVLAPVHLRSVAVTGPGQRDASVVTLVVGDEAIRERIEQARQVLANSMARRASGQASHKTSVELVLGDDPASATVDVVLVTR